ncbi:MAG: hypothetical protein E6K87_07980 [Thaumarchaeota archaeon]|nr:MAG: hypothetical protein E6K87_07980 [Nitrososphaerota archaeon]
MSPKVDIASLTVSKLKSGMSFEKYNIDVSIDEVENNETGIKLKYKFILLSTPTNAKISVEGFTSIQGSEAEVAKHLAPDERNIPLIVNLIYQELFPLFYMTAKSLEIPCPAYKISEISAAQGLKAKTPSQAPQKQQEVQLPEQQEVQLPEQQEVQLPEQQETPREETIEPTGVKENEQTEALEELEHLVEEQNVSPN